MKVADSSMPIVLLQLVAGVIFLSVVSLSAVLVEERLNSSTVSSQNSVLVSPSDDTNPTFFVGFSATMAALEEKINDLSSQNRVVLPSNSSPSQSKIEALLQKRVDEINPKFENLEQNVLKLFALRDDLGGITLKAVEGDVPLTPIVDELQKKVDFLSLEHEKTISPTLTSLTDKVDQLLLNRARNLALLIKEDEQALYDNDDETEADIWDAQVVEANPDIATLAVVPPLPQPPPPTQPPPQTQPQFH
ncbi:MAG: hypothetical protein HQL69_12465, partial [Magnetococcales bacterium]|nr:hypothetical protein [Magnetococcales bacterium]